MVSDDAIFFNLEVPLQMPERNQETKKIRVWLITQVRFIHPVSLCYTSLCPSFLTLLREALCPTRDLWCSLAAPFTFR